MNFSCKFCKRKNAVFTERKADFDVEISVDAVSWQKNFDTFVLFSGDSDFLYLLAYLKKMKKRILILSRRGHIANELRQSDYVDYYQDVFKLRKLFLRRVQKSRIPT